MANFRLIPKKESKRIENMRAAGIKTEEKICPACKGKDILCCFNCNNTRILTMEV